MLKRFCVFFVLICVSFVIAEDVEGEFIHDGFLRTYELHIPPFYGENDSLPLVINLMAKTEALMNDKADSDSFLVVYPENYNGPWNAGEVFEVTYDDVGFIDALIDTLIEHYAIDTLRIFATGYSNGAMMVDRLGCELSHRLAAIAPVAGGLVFEPCQPSRLMPVMHFHARNDMDVPYDGSETWPSIDSTMKRWATVTGCDLGPDTTFNDSGAMRQRWYREDDSCEIILWTTEDGNHTWPGGINIYPKYGNPSQAISATDEMWDFFCVHPLPVVDEEPGIEELIEAPDYVIDPQSPPLFSGSAQINFHLPCRQKVKLGLYDTQGRQIAVLVNEELDEGSHSVMLDAEGLSAGVYFYRLCTPDCGITKSLILVK